MAAGQLRQQTLLMFHHNIHALQEDAINAAPDILGTE